MLARLCSKSFKIGFSTTCMENFQMYKLGFKEAEEPEIKFPTFIASWRKHRNSRKTSTSASLIMQKPLTMDHNKLWKTLKRDGSSRPPYLSPDKPIYRIRSKGYNQTWNNCGSKMVKEYDKAVYCYPTYLTYTQSIS